VAITIRACLRNPTSLLGAGIAGLSLATNLFLLLVDFLAPRQNPYVGILPYLLLPGITLGSLGLTLVGALVQYSRLRRGLQVVELSPPRAPDERRHRRQHDDEGDGQHDEDDAHAPPASNVRPRQLASTTVSELTGMRMAASSGLMRPAAARAAPSAL